MIRFGSLFSGIGGLDLGLERAGMECAWQVEIDEWCRRVLAKHWLDVPRYGDIREVLADTQSIGWSDGLAPYQRARGGQGDSPGDSGSVLGPVDLICGGFPCQPVSLAGKRQGKDDERWLWPEFARTIRLLRPRYVVAENVPGLLSRGFGDVLGDLAALGYDAEWDCIPAAALGASHLRYRVFIVAYANGSELRLQPAGQPRSGKPSESSDDGRQGNVADTNGSRRQGWSRIFGQGWRTELTDGSRWAVEPDVGRVAYGVPRRVDRLRGLGNAVVPQVAEWIGRRIMESAA